MYQNQGLLLKVDYCTQKVIRSQYINILMKGTISNPISLDCQDSQGQHQQEEIMERARRKELLDQAKMSRNPMQLALAVIKTTIKGQLSFKNKTLNRAIIKFFQSKLGFNVSCEHFHPRKDPDYEDNSINPHQFLLYGVDFLTTAMIQDRFKLIDTSIEEIIWINSSTCKLIYKTQSEARLVLQSQLNDKRILEFKIDQESGGQLQGWFTLKPYHFLTFERQLMLRYSTQKENNMQKEEMNKYKEYENAHAQLLPTLFDEFKAHQEFNKVVREIQSQRLEDFRNRNDYHRNRRQFGNFGMRDPSRERSRTRDKKYHRRRNENSQQRGNTSFDFRKKNDSFMSRRGNLNDINTSFQMLRGAEAFRNRQDSNIFNTSFEMKTGNQARNQAGRNQRHDGNWQRNNQNRSNHQNNPNEIEFNVVHRVEYEHRPVDERHMSRAQNNQRMNPPRNNNVYYDCNDIDEQENLSYQFANQMEQSISESDFDKRSFKFNSSKHNKSKEIDKHQLSYIINSLNNSKEDYTNKKMDTSFQLNKSQNQNKSGLNQDLSFVLNASKILEKSGQEKEKLDFNQLFHLDQDISPINQQVLDTSFVMKEPEPVNKNKSRNDRQFLDFRKPQKPKQPERKIIIDDDDGY